MMKGVDLFHGMYKCTEITCHTWEEFGTFLLKDQDPVDKSGIGTNIVQYFTCSEEHTR